MMAVILAVVSIALSVMWIRELRLYFTDREKYERTKKIEMYSDEAGEYPVNTRQRLFIGYPIFIFMFAFGAYQVLVSS